MSQQVNITAFDGAATPVSHTLVVVDNKVLPDGTRFSRWQEMLAGVPDSAQVSMEMKKRTLKSGVVETVTDIYVPVMESISGQNASGYTAAPKVAYVDHKRETTWQHPRSTIATRQITAQLFRNIGNNVSTSVAAVSAGVNYEAHSQGVMPS